MALTQRGSERVTVQNIGAGIEPCQLGTHTIVVQPNVEGRMFQLQANGKDLSANRQAMKQLAPFLGPLPLSSLPCHPPPMHMDRLTGGKEGDHCSFIFMVMYDFTTGVLLLCWCVLWKGRQGRQGRLIDKRQLAHKDLLYHCSASQYMAAFSRNRNLYSTYYSVSQCEIGLALTWQAFIFRYSVCSQ